MGRRKIATYASAKSFLGDHHPDLPVLGLRPEAARRAAHWFMAHFTGPLIYALKANNSPLIVEALIAAGIEHFDVASLAEIEQMSGYSAVTLFLMNPVKSRATIRQGYFDHSIRNFALDSEKELSKIVEETAGARDLTLYVRIKVDGRGSLIAQNNKYGVSFDQAPDLFKKTRARADKLGITFHVGSQAMVPRLYLRALRDIETLILQTGIHPDVIDIGGGFPSVYPDLIPPPLDSYFDEINNGIERLCEIAPCDFQCEPGRALVAEAGSLLVRVEERRAQTLYINDGCYGALFDAAFYGQVHPVRLIGSEKHATGDLLPFSFFGPTCDSADMMPGPFYLPSSVAEGEMIEIGQMGAYGHVLSSRFNGFGAYETIILKDPPLMTAYQGSGKKDRQGERGRVFFAT